MSTKIMIDCPICKENHLKSYLEISKIGVSEANEFYCKYEFVYIYCNYSDEGKEYMTDADT